VRGGLGGVDVRVQGESSLSGLNVETALVVAELTLVLLNLDACDSSVPNAPDTPHTSVLTSHFCVDLTLLCSNGFCHLLT